MLSLIALLGSLSLHAEPPRPLTKQGLLVPHGHVVAPHFSPHASGITTHATPHPGAQVPQVVIEHDVGVVALQHSMAVLVAEEKKTVSVTVKVAPWGDVFVDGIRISNASTQVVVELEKGQHVLEVRNPFSAMHRQTVKVQDPQTEIRIRLLPEPATLLVEADENGILRANDVIVGEVVGGMPTVFELPFTEWRGSEKVQLRFEGERISRSYSMLLEAGKFHSLQVEP
ncbi:MAG: hypothetical protein GY822_32085 [Deltaproteobacteria bacterium]|nr:hypothetical protein [Deltaproteobacteria bacterium]